MAGPDYVHTSTDLKHHPCNNVLDCHNDALIGIHKWPESKWLQLEKAVQPPQDLFSTPPAPEQGAQSSTPAARSLLAVAQPATTTADENIFAPISLQ